MEAEVILQQITGVDVGSPLKTLLRALILVPVLVGSLSAAPNDVPFDRFGPVLRSIMSLPVSERRAATPPDCRSESGDLSAVIDYDGDPDALRAAGVRVRTCLGGIVTAEIPEDSLEQIASMPGLRRIHLSRRFHPLLDASVPDTHAPDVWAGMPPALPGYTGKGVVIGMVDTGIDPNHQDFRDSQGSRILYIWDQTTGTGGDNHPSGYTYGTEWTKAQIDAGQCTATDTMGHGTAVMSIAAGNGSATGNGWPAYRYVGMAPEADIVVVKSTFTDDTIIDGMNYIKNRADALGKRCVVNLSIGSQMGAHDGTDVVERAIDVLTGQGAVVCTATGNNGNADPTRYVHAEWATPAKNSQVEAGLSVLANHANPFYLDIWYEGSDSIDITITTPNGYSVTKPTGSTTGGYHPTPDGSILIENAPGPPDPYNGDRECIVIVQNALVGAWKLTATGRSIQAGGACDAWIETNQNVFWSSRGTNLGSCTIPGTSQSAITVGGYVTKSQWTNPDGTQQGWGSTFGSFYTASGTGPTRDGRQKPELCVPSSRIAASLSAACGVNPVNIVEDGVHSVQTGTSMAVPHMAGAAALLLQRDPTATPAEIKSHVVSTARSDSLTGAVPNIEWGSGKLDVQAAADATPLYAGISVARLQPDGTPVKIPAQVVTAGLSRLLDRFYVESDSRSSGIQVRTGPGSGIQAEEGNRVTVRGIVGLADGERAVLNPTVTPSGSGAVPEPLAMPNRYVGGARLGDRVPGVTGGRGLNNLGLLVTVWGTVKSVAGSHFYIDDGTGITGGSPGLKISCGSMTKPAPGGMVRVTGISALEMDGLVSKPVVRARKPADLTYY